jgi:hypothetical protein
MDYEEIKEIAKRYRCRISELMALSDECDPFWITPARAQDAEWAARLWTELEMPSGGHARGLHYKIVSQKKPVLMRRGVPYLNTEDCWDVLSEAFRDARYLGLINASDVVDRRNAEPIDYGNESFEDTLPSPLVSRHVLLPKQESKEMPSPPSAWLTESYGTGRRQPYRIELWIEKSTMNDILEPIARRYGLIFVPGTGETSATRCHQVIQRAEADDRPVRILYISDFDPGGLSMPLTAARKVEFFAQERGLDIQLERIALTFEQCGQWDLPRTPIKESETRKDKFEERWGRGATELDALEALHPGELGRIVEEAILRFYDDTLANRTRAVAGPIQIRLNEVTEAAQDRHREHIDRLGEEFEQIFADYAEACAEWEAKAQPIWNTIADEIEGEIGGIMEDVEWPEAEEADEYDEPLYDSLRDYVDQIDHYKEFQGKAE